MPKGQFQLSDESKMVLMARQQVFKWLRIHKTITGKEMKLGMLGAKKGPKVAQGNKKAPKT